LVKNTTSAGNCKPILGIFILAAQLVSASRPLAACFLSKAFYFSAMRRLERIFSITVIAAILLGIGAWVGFKLTSRRDHSQPHEESTSTVIRQVQSLADLVTVKYVVEKVVILDAPPESTLGQFVQGDNRVLLLAHGVVKAGIDLKHFSPADISISGKSIRIQLPPAQITDAYLDDNLTKVIDWKQGFLRSFDKDLEQTARQMAVEDIRRAARTDGILNEATQRAQWQLAVFFQNAGFERVEFFGQTVDGAPPAFLPGPKD
jgi:Protein of unknown function (DUF4230)